jgi:hypothetical protein
MNAPRPAVNPEGGRDEPKLGAGGERGVAVPEGKAHRRER